MRTRYVDIDDRNEDLREMLQSKKDRARLFAERFDQSWIYHDNALEGIVFSGAELMAALDPNGVAADATMVPIFTEIRNHRAAIDLVRAESRATRKPAISLTLIKKLYEILGQGIEGRAKVEYRKEMPLHRSYFHDIVQPAKIASLLDKLVRYCATTEFREFHPVKQAGTLQHNFMQIFPFTENSGKVARMLSNLLLLRGGYLPAIIHAVDRQRYYESLRLPPTSLVNLLMEAVENSQDNAFKFLAEPIYNNRGMQKAFSA